jgi:hypothetical protein
VAIPDSRTALPSEDRFRVTEWMLVSVALFALGVTLPVVPRHFSTDPSVLSVATVEGFSTPVAYRLALVWCLALVAAAWLLVRRRQKREPQQWMSAASSPGVTTSDPRRRRGRGEWVEIAVVALLTLVAFWPPFLAVSAPYVEDNNFLVALQRMHAGMVPYRDFEYLYGPLMLVPASWWMHLTGFAGRHYYEWLAALEVVVAVTVVLLAQRYIRDRGARLVAIAILLALLANPLLGLNYNGIRRLLPIVALLLLSHGFDDVGRRVGAAALIGLSIAWSHEQGLAALVAAGAIFSLALRDRPGSDRGRVITHGLVFLAVALGVWLVSALATLGPAFGSYLGEVRTLMARFSAGEAGFPFRWTLNAAAVFALVALGAVCVGRGLASRAEPAAGDRFALGALVVAIVSLKSGLTRADMFHLDAGVLGLAMVFLFPMHAPRLGPPSRVARVGRATVALAAATYAFGMLPTVKAVADGWMAGARATLSGTPTLHLAFVPAAPALMRERVAQDSATVAVATWLADPIRRNRPVLFAGRLWSVGLTVGVYKRDFLNDKFIYGDERAARERKFLEANRDVLVIIDRSLYDRIRADRPDTAFATWDDERSNTLVKRLAQRLSSVHFDDVLVEDHLHDLKWQRALGDDLRAQFDSVWGVDPVVVLARRPTVSGSPSPVP